MEVAAPRVTAAQDQGMPWHHDGRDQADLGMKVHRVPDVDGLPVGNDAGGRRDSGTTPYP
jgi:hypothetical protein